MSDLRSITSKGVFVAKYAATSVTNTKVSVAGSSTAVLYDRWDNERFRGKR